VPAVRFHDGNTDGDLDGGSQEGDNTLYYTTDANFNVTALVDAETGGVVERYMYDPYGKATVCEDDWTPREDNASAVANEILYCGYRYDPETGLDQVRYRYYHPTLGRWISRDPIGATEQMTSVLACEIVKSARDAALVKLTGRIGLMVKSTTRAVLEYADGPDLYVYSGLHPTFTIDPTGLGVKGSAAIDYAHLAITAAERAQVANAPKFLVDEIERRCRDRIDAQAARYAAEVLGCAPYVDILFVTGGLVAIFAPTPPLVKVLGGVVGALGAVDFLLGVKTSRDITAAAEAAKKAYCVLC
jgi:RHS repeat-associated protein